MLTQWLQPIPEKKYLRCVYVGNLKLVHKSGTKYKKPTLEEMIEDIWKVASEFNRENFIAGHLSCSRTLHVVQCLEGKENVTRSLMGRIIKDPRVRIHKIFYKLQPSMHIGWALSMCYSFDITKVQLMLVQNEELTMESIFDMMKTTFEAVQEKLHLPTFYKEIMETMLLKYITVTHGHQKIITA